MADKKVHYKQGPLNLELDAKDDLHPNALNPPHDLPKQLSTRTNAEDVADAVARLLDDSPGRVRLSADITSDVLREAARRARVSQQNLDAGNRMQELLKRESAQRRHELQEMLVRVHNQVKSQKREDSTILDDFKQLTSYFKANK